MPRTVDVMDSSALAAIVTVAERYRSPEKALHQCSVAREQLIDELLSLGFGEDDLQRIEVSGPIGATRPHVDLHCAHQVLRVGNEIFDVTWAQIDTEGETAWKMYPSIDALRQDWADVRDWTTRAPISPRRSRSIERQELAEWIRMCQTPTEDEPATHDVRSRTGA